MNLFGAWNLKMGSQKSLNKVREVSFSFQFSMACQDPHNTEITQLQLILMAADSTHSVKLKKAKQNWISTLLYLRSSSQYVFCVFLSFAFSARAKNTRNVVL